MTGVEGGSLNRMWRLETDQGVFAVTELALDRDWTYRPLYDDAPETPGDAVLHVQRQRSS